VDASVFLNAFNPYEVGHEASHRLLDEMQERGTPIIVPTLLLPEVAGAVSQARGEADLARRFAAALGRLPPLVWVPLDATLARQAMDLAAQNRLPGADAVYATVALRFASTLVTLDQEQQERLMDVLSAHSPSEVLEGHP